MNNNYIAVYGSLRKGEYNYKRFKNYFKEGLEYIETATLIGYNLFDLGSYPGIKPTHDKKTLTVDIMSCNSECFTHIEHMELGANYHAEQIKIDNYLCTIYIYNGYTVKEVPHGDWSKYLKEKEKQLVW